MQSYFDTLLRYAVTFCGAVVLKVMDQKTLVKRRWGYKVRLTVYILTLGEFARHEFTNLSLETLPDTLSLSLTGIRQPQTSKTSEQRLASHWQNDRRSQKFADNQKFSADLFPAHRCPSAKKFKIRLECASVNWSNVLLISKVSFPANKMNWM